MFMANLRAVVNGFDLETGVLTSVVLQQDYGGVNCASAGINRAGR